MGANFVCTHTFFVGWQCETDDLLPIEEILWQAMPDGAAVKCEHTSLVICR